MTLPAPDKRHARPPFLTSLIGRESELDALLALLAEGHRLITIVGPGGVGKTTLATHLAHTLSQEFGRDVVVVPLSAVSDPEMVLSEIAMALDMEDHALRHGCLDPLRERHPLLVLDHLEQVLAAGPVLADLLTRVQDLVMLITSRAPLRVHGEQLYPLAPLAVPALDAALDVIASNPAVTLFVARARAVRPAFRFDAVTGPIVSRICQRLDGLPLAIELAAARCAILSPRALSSRLDNQLNNQMSVPGSEQRDLPKRLRTLRNAISWSYTLLEPDQQQLFRRLSIFPGDITIESVEGIVQTDPEPGDTYGMLSALVDHALVQSRSDADGTSTFTMLNTLRDFGREQLEAVGEVDRTRLVFVTWAVGLAEEAEPELVDGGRSEWFRRLELEWPNLRSAIEWAMEQGQFALALRILIATWRFVVATGRASEARRYLDRALQWDDVAVTPLRLNALNVAGNLAEDQRDLDVAETRFQATLEGARTLRDASLIGSAEMGLGRVSMDRGDTAAALEHFEHALVAAKRAGNRRLIAAIHGNLGNLHYHRGDLVGARNALEQCLAEFRALGDERGALIARSNLGAIMTDMGDYHGARVQLTQVVEGNRELENADNLPAALSNLGQVWFLLGDAGQANQFLEEAMGLLCADRHPGMWVVVAVTHLGILVEQERYAESARLAVDCVIAVEQTGDRNTLTRTAIQVASICQKVGRPHDALRLLFGAKANLAKHPLPPDEAKRFDSIVENLRPALSPEVWTEQERIGRAMGFEDLAHDTLLTARSLAKVEISPEPVAAVPLAENPLTKREQEVLRYLVEGASSRTMAEALFISPRTASTHVENILRKLETNSRSAVVALALRNGWV